MGALADIRVVDFSRVLAGPFSTMMLADLGATVVKIERPGTGDETRSWGPPYDDQGEATYFQAVNRNKRSITLDLADPHDSATARGLASEADVLVENFRPGVMERMNLGFDRLKAEHPGLIYCSITGFGAGVGSSLPGYDLLLQALGGLMSITGTPDREPQKVGVALVDVLTGLFATTGILAALHHRDRHGCGQRVEVDLLSSLLAALVNQGSAYTLAGVVPKRIGNAHPSISPYDLFETKDNDMVLAVGNDQQFAALCRVLGHPGLAADERFASNTDRVLKRDELKAELELRLRARGGSQWAEELTAAGVPAGTVNDVGSAFDLAEALGLDPIVAIPRDDGSEAKLTRNPIRLSVTPATYRSAPPRFPAS